MITTPLLQQGSASFADHRSYIAAISPPTKAIAAAGKEPMIGTIRLAIGIAFTSSNPRYRTPYQKPPSVDDFNSRATKYIEIVTIKSVSTAPGNT